MCHRRKRNYNVGFTGLLLLLSQEDGLRIAFTLLALLAGILSSGIAHADDVDDVFSDAYNQGACDGLTKQYAKQRAELPIKDASGRTTYGIMIDCSKNSLTIQRSYNYAESSLKRGWYDVVSKLWSSQLCADKVDADLVAHGWHLAQTIKFKGAGKIYSMEAKC